MVDGMVEKTRQSHMVGQRNVLRVRLALIDCSMTKEIFIPIPRDVSHATSGTPTAGVAAYILTWYVHRYEQHLFHGYTSKYYCSARRCPWIGVMPTPV